MTPEERAAAVMVKERRTPRATNWESVVDPERLEASIADAIRAAMAEALEEEGQRRTAVEIAYRAAWEEADVLHSLLHEAVEYIRVTRDRADWPDCLLRDAEAAHERWPTTHGERAWRQRGSSGGARGPGGRAAPREVTS